MKIDLDVRETLSPAGTGRELDALPWLKYVPFQPGYKHLMKIVTNLWDWHEGRRVRMLFILQNKSRISSFTQYSENTISKLNISMR